MSTQTYSLDGRTKLQLFRILKDLIGREKLPIPPHCDLMQLVVERNSDNTVRSVRAYYLQSPTEVLTRIERTTGQNIREDIWMPLKRGSDTTESANQFRLVNKNITPLHHNVSIHKKFWKGM